MLSTHDHATIATLTMNPALDISASTANVIPTHKIRCSTPRYDPGGGGINVARVIHTLGGEATAVYPAGGTTGQMLGDLLEAQGISLSTVSVNGQTRENLAITEEATNEQYRFVLPGPTLTHEDQERCLQHLADLQPSPRFLVASGSLAPGVPPDFYARVAHLAREIEAKLVLDTSGAPLRLAGEEGVFLMKPSLRELNDLAGRDLTTQQMQIEFGRELLRQDHAEAMVLSLGAEGALLITARDAEHFPALDVPKVSSVGAGDSMVGGMVVALARGESLSSAVRFGMAAGAGALMTGGTALCRREDVERLYRSLSAPG